MIILFYFLSYWLGLSFKYCWYIYILLIIGFIVFLFTKYTKKIALISMGLMFLGMGCSLIKIQYPNKTNYTGMVYEVKDNYYLLNSGFERLYVYEKDTSKEVGDILSISGSKSPLDFQMLESSFNFKEYLNNRGVFSELKTYKTTYKFYNPIRLHRTEKYFLSHFDKLSQDLLKSNVFSQGDKGELVDSVRELHLGKFLSANGTYIYAYLAILSWLINKFVSQKVADISSFAISMIYLVFLFPKFSMLRVAALFLFRWFNKYAFKKKFDYLSSLSIVGLAFLVINPYLAKQNAFILGFSVPIAFYIIKDSFKGYNKYLKKILSLIWLYIFLIPFELDFYNSIAPLSMIYGFILTPIFILIGFISIFCLFNIPLYKVVGFLCSKLLNINSFLATISFEIYAPKPNPILTFLFYVLFFILLYYIKIRFIPIIHGITFSYIIFALFYFVPVKNFITSQVSFINVGQGDSCLIRHKDKTVLIDTGGLTYLDLAKQNLIPYFKKQRIYKIDTVITTHEDFDHKGALDSLSKNFKVNNYVYEPESFPLKVGNITFYNYNNHIYDMDDENGKSLVIGFKLAKRDYLIMGDATKQIESYIMEEYSYIPCDILKIGHHGSDTSSSYSFLKYISPKEAIISVGKNNSYHLPKDSVLSNLKSLNIPIKRTDYLGSITYIDYIFNAL